MSKIRFKLAEYLQDRCLTPEKLIKAVGTDTSPTIIYQLVKNGNEQRQIDLCTLAAIQIPSSLFLLPSSFFLLPSFITNGPKVYPAKA